MDLGVYEVGDSSLYDRINKTLVSLKNIEPDKLSALDKRSLEATYRGLIRGKDDEALDDIPILVYIRWVYRCYH